MKAEFTPYGGWRNCCQLSNGRIELIVTTEVGPRIIRFGYQNDSNMFVEFPEDMGQVGGDTWRPYGGHRFWHGPEDHKRTYIPDNTPVIFEELEDGVKLTQSVETQTYLQKEMEIRMDEDEDRVEIIHRLHNQGLWPITCSPWALSMMAVGGTAVIPLPPFRPHGEALLPTSSLILWPYTDLSDPRWKVGSRFITLRQDPRRPESQKLGSSYTDGWLGYVFEDKLFIKTFSPEPDGEYPDMGSKLEIFTNDVFLELETLGAFKPIHPGSFVEHTETWYLHRDEAFTQFDEEGPKIIKGFLPQPIPVNFED